MPTHEAVTLEAFDRLHSTLRESIALAEQERESLRHLEVTALLSAAAARASLVERLGQQLASGHSALASLSQACGADGTLAGLERQNPEIGARVRTAVERAKAAARDLNRADTFNHALARSASRLLRGMASRLPARGRSYDGAGAAAPLPPLATRSTTA